MPLQAPGGERARHLPPTKICGGRALEPGLWQFVAELRSPDTTEIVKRAHARFAVSPSLPVGIGADGRDLDTPSDTTWTNDEVLAIRHQVFGNAGATLTIEPGSLIVARAVSRHHRGARWQDRGLGASGDAGRDDL